MIFNQRCKILHYQFVIGIGQNILNHHTSYLGDLSEGKRFEKFDNQLCDKLKMYLAQFDIPHLEQILSFIPHDNGVKGFAAGEQDFNFFFLLRLHYSLLTAADYYATAHFYGKWKEPYSQFGVFDEREKVALISNLKNLQPHNKSLFENLKEIIAIKEGALREKSSKNLNKLRSRLAAEVLHNISESYQEKLFYVEAPTGGGKTNISMIAALRLMELNPELNKIYYVFPFTTLITQTLKATKETIGLSEDQFIELHGKAGFKIKEEESGDGLYGAEKLDDLHNQFANYPLTFLTHIRFFDILKKNQKDAIYLMHRLANSVVIIDEVQAYNPLLWDKLAYLLRQYADALNIRFIVMSATLPKIGQLADANFITLVPDAINRFFKNPNFSERVKFDGSWLNIKRPNKDEKPDYLEALAEKVKREMEEYKSKNGSVRAIIEFIFKKSASDFEQLAREKFKGYKILLLSGTILEPKRRQIINYLKNPDHYLENILLVTTQVVEAGVDIDMDLGFKDRSLIDSEEQLAGRVNRNVKKTGCKVFLFDLDDAAVIYGKDLRYKEIKKTFEANYLQLLAEKRFDEVYERVAKWLNENNAIANMGGSLPAYQRALNSQNFPKVDKDFMLIEQNNITVFVPIELPVFIKGAEGRDEAVFTRQQIDFLTSFNLSVNDFVCGKEVFDLYKSLITDKSTEYPERKRNIKQIQSILSLFSFSLFAESGVVKELQSGGDQEEFGYLYLSRYNEVYSLDSGLLDKQFENLIFL